MKYAPWLSLALFPIHLFGYGADDVTRSTPPPESMERSKLVDSSPVESEEEVVEDDQQVLLESLTGVVVAPDAARALRLQAKTRSGVKVDGFTTAEERIIREIVGSYLNQPVTLGGLDRMLKALAQAAREEGHVLHRVSFPAQEITSGVVAVRMGPATVGSVKLAGELSFGKDHILQTIRSRPGAPLDGSVVMDDIEWLNRNPLRRTTISPSPADDDDTLDLTLRVRAAQPWRVYGGIDNQLSESLGDERLFVGFQHGDVFHLDHRVVGQLTTSVKNDALLGGSASYEIPLPHRQLIAISGGYTESETDVAGPLDQSGEFARLTLDHRVQLPRWHGISHEWRSGVEYRDNNYLFPNGTSTSVNFFQLFTGWEGRRSDAWGSTRWSALALYNPGRGFLGSEDADYRALGADGAESLILRMQMDRVQKLGKLGALSLRMRGQWSDVPLLASDQLSAGGLAGVRGFDEVVGYASVGCVANLEWQSPLWSSESVGDWMGVVFLDGALLDRDAPADPGELASAGLGCRFRWSDHLAGRLDLGFPLKRPDTVDSQPVLHFAVNCKW